MRCGNCLMPRAKSARGKVRGALPRSPARGDAPLRPPARFPCAVMFRNGPRRQGCAPENLFNRRKDFPPPRTNRAPWPAAGRSEDLPMIRESGQVQSQNQFAFAGLLGLPLVGPEFVQTLRERRPGARRFVARLQAHSWMRICWRRARDPPATTFALWCWECLAESVCTAGRVPVPAHPTLPRRPRWRGALWRAGSASSMAAAGPG